MKKAYVALAIAAVIIASVPPLIVAFAKTSKTSSAYTTTSAGRDLTTFAAKKGVSLAIKWCKGPRHGYYGCAAVATAPGQSPACIGVIFKSQPVRILQATKIDPRTCA